jgi:phosphoribosyl 1,2-cyclic phosphodiesterase
MSMKVKYWGVRGSLPYSPSPEQLVKEFEHLMHSFFKAGHKSPNEIKEFIRSMSVPAVGGFGTATTCVEVTTEKGRIIIDGGSGIKSLGDHLIKTGEGRGPFHIFLTHFHWDHLIGIPFFVPHFIPGTKINYYAVQPELELMVRGKFKRPYFPVPFEGLRSDIKFHSLEPRKPMIIDDMKITPYLLDHPDPCWGFRIESGGKVYSHCVDTEGTRQSQESLGPDLPLYQNVDLMYFDAQYTLPELAEKANWGHSAAQIGLDIAFREGIKFVLFAHHDPGASTSQIYDLKEQTREYYHSIVNSTERIDDLPKVKWRFAYEGLEIDLSKL